MEYNENEQKNDMKESAPTHAGETVALQSSIKKWTLIALLALVAVVVIGFFAAQSLPGSPLYSLKTSFFEMFGSSVQLTSEGRASGQVDLFRTRLEELKELVKREQVSENAIANLQEQVALHSTAFHESLDSNQENLSSTDILQTIQEFAEIAAAMEVIGESDPRFGTFGDFMEDVRRETVSAYRDRVDRFVERATPEDIFSFIQARLTEVSGELENADLNESVIDDAEVYINRVGPAMTEGDFPRAINAIAEAMRFIRIETYGANAIAAQFESEVNVTDEGEDEEEVGTTSEPEPTASEPGGSTFEFAQ